jgi:hypothetical protein
MFWFSGIFEPQFKKANCGNCGFFFPQFHLPPKVKIIAETTRNSFPRIAEDEFHYFHLGWQCGKLDAEKQNVMQCSKRTQGRNRKSANREN